MADQLPLPPARCPACGVAHVAGSSCGPGREAAWSIVKDRGMAKANPRITRWARKYLGLDER